jgi:hypothetical protein
VSLNVCKKPQKRWNTDALKIANLFLQIIVHTKHHIVRVFT